ncbi:unnamed protein product [Anisakis simplex]|uniref:DUF1394 domain-containing protein n=1 Tax=Anisakis simplex TaxID=6269 RepID=A0A0M3JMN5_ANISI|nr:unnamed protein product [Anisakis simplex]
MDVCPTNVSKEKIERAERFAKLIQEKCTSYMELLTNVREHILLLADGVTDIPEFDSNVNATTYGVLCGSLKYVFTLFCSLLKKG